MTHSLFTIGHSNHELPAFLALLRKHGVTALADVRSHPYSRYVPQYSYDALKTGLTEAGIRYVFLGAELGARSDNPDCYVQGKVQYDRLAQQPNFRAGLERVMKGLEQFDIALMCAEKDPLDCHRALLVARQLHELSLEILHIHADGATESHAEMETRLLEVCKLPPGDMFKSRAEFIADAYVIRANRVAYQDEAMEQPTQSSS